VGKKRQRERRKEQARRAATSGDRAALAALGERQPSAAARALIDTLATMPALAFDPIVSDVAGRLRREGACAAALSLLAVAGRKTRRLRAEEALAAMGVGDEARARDAIAGDEILLRKLGPAVGMGRLGRPSATATAPGAPLLRGLAQVTSGTVAAAVKELDAVALADRSRLFVDEVLDSLTLANKRPGPRAKSAVARLAGTALVRGDARAEELLGAAAATHHADIPKTAPGGVVLAARLATATTSTERAAIAADLDPSAFPAAERGAALLARAFLRFPRAERGAGPRLFDAALAAGADRLEALRGRAIALSASYDPMCRCERCEGEASSAAEAWLLLARELGEGPGVDALVLSAAKAASDHAGFAVDRARVVRARAIADAVAARSALMTDDLAAELDADHGGTFLAAEPERARELAEAAVARCRRSTKAWDLRLAALIVLGRPTDALRREAYAATGDEQFAAEARDLDRKEGRELPLVAGQRPGAVADQLGWRAKNGHLAVPFTDEVASALDSLGDRAAAAACAYAMVRASDAGNASLATTILERAIAATRSSDGARILAETAVTLQLGDALVTAVRASAATIPAELVAPLVEGAWLDRQASQRIFLSLCDRLGAIEIGRLRRVPGSKRRPSVVGIAIADELLKPDVSLTGLLDAVDESDGAHADPDDVVPHLEDARKAGLPPELISFATACTALGLDVNRFLPQLSTPAGMSLVVEIARIVEGPRTPAAEARVNALFAKLGATAPSRKGKR
jgi:hypothetical protein